jgi:hypothetical protein
MRNFKLLGVFLDENLTFNKHPQNLSAKLTRSIFCMKRVAQFVTAKALKSLYYALVHSHLLYCPIILNCMTQTSLNNISRLQRKAIRVMTNSTYNATTEPLFYANNILPFDKLILQSKLLFMHSIEYNYAPNSFADIYTKNNAREIDHNLRNAQHYYIPNIRIEHFRKNPLISLPMAWNELAEEIRFQQNRTTFKIALSHYLSEQLLTA